MPVTSNLRRHKVNPTIFMLFVDEFGEKYTGGDNAKHLINNLRTKCIVTMDQEAKLYVVITLKLG